MKSIILKRAFIFSIIIFSLVFLNFSSGFAENISLSEFDGKRIAVTTGTIHDEVVREVLPSAKILYFESDADSLAAVLSGKADAYADDEEILEEITKGNNKLDLVDGYLKPFDNALIFAKTPQSDKLRGEFNEYFKRIKSDGTLNNINNIWFGDDENLKTLLEYENLPDINGIIKIAVSNESSPFDYVKDGRIAGYEADIIVRFCKDKGYKPVFVPGNFGSVIPSVVSGKCQVGMGLITITEERTHSVNFSVPTYIGGTRLLVLKSSNGKYAGLSVLERKRIGVTTGSTHPQIVAKYVPTAKLVYFDSTVDTLLALKAGKIDAACTGLPMLREIMTEDDSIMPFGEQLTFTEGAPIFAKNDKGRKLCEQFSEFAKACWDNGTIKELDAFWFEQTESKRTMKDYSNLPATNGILKMAVNEGAPPFVYMKNNRIVGYDIDFVVRFCEAYGYGLEIMPMSFSGIIPAVMSGKCDLAIGAITITDERKESVLFSYPNIKTGNIFAVRKPQKSAADTKPKYKSIAELNGKPIGVQVGVDEWANMVKTLLPASEIVYYNTFADIAAAINSHKIEAFLVDEPVLNLMSAENKNITKIDEKIDESYYFAFGFPKTEKGKKLCDEISEFIRSIKASGELDKIIAKWEGTDESKKTIPDYKNFPAPKGVLSMVTEGEYPPFNYIRKKNEFAGFEIDIAARFCEAYGYGLEITAMFWTSVLPALISNKYDFTANLVEAEEHKNNLYFSEPYCKSRSVMACLKSSEQPVATRTYSKLSELEGCKVGIILGANHDIFAKEKISDVKIEYFNDLSAVTLALKAGKIDAFANTLPTAIYMTHEDKDISYIAEPLENTLTYSAFTNSEKGQKICAEYAEFIKSLWENGAIKKLSDKWIYSEDESKRTIKDYSKLPAPNGVLKMAIDTGRMPFAYVKDNIITGYDIELAAMFCEAKGYGLEVYSMNFAGILGAIKTGKCDLTGSITKTDERAETMLFSPVANAETPIVLLVMKNENSALSKFNGKKIGVQVGGTCADLVPEKFPLSEISYFNSLSDALTALKTGKVEAMCCALSSAVYAVNEDTSLEIVEPYLIESYLYSLFVSSDRGQKLCEEYSDFLQTLWDDGTIDEISNKWLGADESKKTVDDYSKLPAINGTLKMAVDTSIIPFAYVKDNKIVGHAVDLAVRFCKAKGYGLEISDMSLSAVIASVKTGKCDFTQAMTRTKEREENALFATSPNIKSGNVLLTVKSEKPAAVAIEKDAPSFLSEIAASFERTFIREDRYRLFIEGIINTMIITILSIFFGMILGFTVFMLCRTGNIFANIMTKFSVWLIKGTPIVVLLMIFYYIIFGKININGIWVAVIAFTLTFGTSVYRMLTFGTGALDKGQTEAAYALGYTDLQTFFTIILPQAALHFMPSFREEVTTLIKSTAVVGYIAVQDLTKMGDIVRSRTYEAFFPLIAVAVIYFILAGLLNIVILRIHWKIIPSKRKPEDILKGINLKGDINHD